MTCKFKEMATVKDRLPFPICLHPKGSIQVGYFTLSINAHYQSCLDDGEECYLLQDMENIMACQNRLCPICGVRHLMTSSPFRG